MKRRMFLGCMAVLAAAAVAGCGAGTAAVALLLIDFNDPSYHSLSPFRGFKHFCCA